MGDAGPMCTLKCHSLVDIRRLRCNTLVHACKSMVQHAMGSGGMACTTACMNANMPPGAITLAAKTASVACCAALSACFGALILSHHMHVVDGPNADGVTETVVEFSTSMHLATHRFICVTTSDIKPQIPDQAAPNASHSS